jgi:hypothetical protein
MISNNASHDREQLPSVRRIGPEVGSDHQIPELRLSDLQIVDPEVEQALQDAGYRVVVDVAVPVPAALHRSVPDLVKARLQGRNPFVWQAEDYLRVTFAVEDHSPATVGIVDRFVGELGALLGTDLVDRQFYISLSEPELTLL